MAINAIQAAIRSLTGTERQFNGDLHAYWDQLGIPPGQFAERMVAWQTLPQNAAWLAAEAWGSDGGFVVGDLWKAGEQGIYLDASDLSTMFQDAAGTLPVYAPGQGQVDPPVGRILDKSGRGNHAYQTTTTRRPTLSARYNLLTGTESLSTQSVTVAATTYTLTTAGPGSVTLSGAASGTYTAGSRMVTCTAGTLTLTVSGSVTQADLRPAKDGVGLPPYQRVVDANTYDTMGFPLYLRFDGVDDFLQTASIDFSGSDKLLFAAALRKLSDTSGILAELGSDSSSVNGTFGINPSPSNLAGSFGARLRGTTPVGANAPGHASPKSLVASVLFDIAKGAWDTSETIRLNGVPQAASKENAFGDSAGSGSFGNQPLYIGRRAGTTLPFNGRLYGLIIRSGASSSAQITAVEKLLNQKAKVF